VTVRQIMDEAKAAMEPVFARTKFSKPAYEQRRDCWSSGCGVFSHAVGMAVHDDGGYETEPLKPGRCSVSTRLFACPPKLVSAV